MEESFFKTYNLEKILGKGSYGIVFSAVAKTSSKFHKYGNVAVKFIRVHKKIELESKPCNLPTCIDNDKLHKFFRKVKDFLYTFMVDVGIKLEDLDFNHQGIIFNFFQSILSFGEYFFHSRNCPNHETCDKYFSDYILPILFDYGLSQFIYSTTLEDSEKYQKKLSVLEANTIPNVAVIYGHCDIKINQTLTGYTYKETFDYTPSCNLVTVIMKEYISYTEVTQKLGNPLPTHLMMNMSRDLINGVHGLHSYGITHQDIHSRNILYDEVDKKTVLCDIGLSSVVTVTQNILFYYGDEYVNKDMKKNKGWDRIFKCHDNYRLFIVILEICDGAKVDTKIDGIFSEFFDLFKIIRDSCYIRDDDNDHIRGDTSNMDLTSLIDRNLIDLIFEGESGREKYIKMAGENEQMSDDDIVENMDSIMSYCAEILRKLLLICGNNVNDLDFKIFKLTLEGENTDAINLFHAFNNRFSAFMNEHFDDDDDDTFYHNNKKIDREDMRGLTMKRRVKEACVNGKRKRDDNDDDDDDEREKKRRKL